MKVVTWRSCMRIVAQVVVFVLVLRDCKVSSIRAAAFGRAAATRRPLVTLGEWSAYRDSSTSVIYYFNPKTGESSWVKPSRAFPTVVDTTCSAAASPPVVVASDGDWSKYADPNGRAYYYNRKTGVSQWKRPTGHWFLTEACPHLDFFSKLVPEQKPASDAVSAATTASGRRNFFDAIFDAKIQVEKSTPRTKESSWLDFFVSVKEDDDTFKEIAQKSSPVKGESKWWLRDWSPTNIDETRADDQKKRQRQSRPDSPNRNFFALQTNQQKTRDLRETRHPRSAVEVRLEDVQNDRVKTAAVGDAKPTLLFDFFEWIGFRSVSV